MENQKNKKVALQRVEKLTAIRIWSIGRRVYYSHGWREDRRYIDFVIFVIENLG